MENNLDNDVRNADALGLSYGYYKALTYNHDASRVKVKKPGKVCPVCGKEVRPPQITVCSKECAKIRQREYNRARRHDDYMRSKYKKTGEDE